MYSIIYIDQVIAVNFYCSKCSEIPSVQISILSLDPIFFCDEHFAIFKQEFIATLTREEIADYLKEIKE